MTDAADPARTRPGSQPNGWSDATHYGGGAVLARTFTEADPMTASAASSAFGAPRGTADWGSTTFGGRRSRRPRMDPAALGADAPASSPVVVEPALDASVGSDQSAESDQTLLSNSRSMAVASLASRVTGFARTIMLGIAIGQGAVGTAYNTGNTLPNMIYELLLGGVLSSVLIPLLVKAESQDGDGGVGYLQRMLSMATLALAVMTALVVTAAPWLSALAPAGADRSLTTTFAYLLLPEIFFYGLGAMLMAALNTRHSYAPGAWSPLLNNVVMMVTLAVFWALPGPAVLTSASITTAQVLVLGIGTSLGIAAQALVLVPALRRTGFRWAWRLRALPNERERLREMGALGGWVLSYVVVSQIGVFVILGVGNRNGGYSVFTNADLLFQMPYGILVVSVLTAIMPRLSRAAVRGDHDQVIADLSLGARLSAVSLVPITAGLIALGVPFALALFDHGQTDHYHAELIGSSLAYSAFGLVPFALVMLQLRVFYAMHDGRTPTIINIAMVACKVTLVLITNAVFRAPAGTDVQVHPSAAAVQWLAISTALSYVVGAVVGHIALRRRLGHLGFAAVGRTVVQVGVAAAIGGAAAWGVVYGVRSLLGDTRVADGLGVVLGALVGVAVMAAVAVLAGRAGVGELRQLAAQVRR